MSDRDRDASSKAGGKLASGSLGALFLTVFLDLLGFGLVMPLLPRYARELHATSLHVGLLGAAYSAMQFVFVPIWGRLSDRVGRRPVLLGSILASAVAMAMMGYANSLAWLFAARIFGGIATANIATAQAYIADSTTSDQRARGMGLIGMAFGLGFVLGPFAGGLLSDISLSAPAKVASALSLVNLVWAWFSLPESLSESRRAEATARPKSARIGIDTEALRRALAIPGLGVLFVLFFVAALSFSNLEQTFSLYANDEFRLNAKQTGSILGTVGIVAAVVQGGFIGRLNRRFGEISLIRAGTVVQTIAFALYAALPGTTVSGLYVGAVLLAFGNALTNPSLSTLASKLAPAAALGETLGVMQSMGALARVFGPTWGGFTYDHGHRLPYWSGAIGLAVASVFAWWLPSAPDARARVAADTRASDGSC
ncbi:MAG: MFS transporter [Polyangiales bacterium]